MFAYKIMSGLRTASKSIEQQRSIGDANSNSRFGLGLGVCECCSRGVSIIEPL